MTWVAFIIKKKKNLLVGKHPRAMLTTSFFLTKFLSMQGIYLGLNRSFFCLIKEAKKLIKLSDNRSFSWIQCVVYSLFITHSLKRLNVSVFFFFFAENKLVLAKHACF